jgi:hypothetical protein
MERKDTRPLTVNGQPWEYKIGRNTVAIYDTEGNRYFPKFTDIVGEQAVNDKLFYLNPAVILDYILTKIIGEEPKHKICYCCKIAKADVHLQVNPYQAEIEGDYSKHYLCNECYGDLSDEI